MQQLQNMKYLLYNKKKILSASPATVHKEKQESELLNKKGEVWTKINNDWHLGNLNCIRKKKKKNLLICSGF